MSNPDRSDVALIARLTDALNGMTGLVEPLHGRAERFMDACAVGILALEQPDPGMHIVAARAARWELTALRDALARLRAPATPEIPIRTGAVEVQAGGGT